RHHAAIAFCLNRLGGLPDQAVKHNEMALQSGFATAEVFNNLAFNCLSLNKRKEARENLDRALQLNEDLQAAHHNRAHLNLAEAFLKLGQPGPAAKRGDAYRDLTSGIDDIRKAIALGPKSAELYFDAARLCAMAARTDARWLADGMSYLEQSLDQGADPNKRF